MEVTAKNAEGFCSTFLFPQEGHFKPLLYSLRVRTRVKLFLHFGQVKS